MTEDQDNAGEVVAATVRVALTAAGQLAEQAARRREAGLRQAEQDSVAQAATLHLQLAAERQLALLSVPDVLRRGETASVEEFAQAWQQIRSWEDPVAAVDRNRLRGAIVERFGVDPDSLSAPASSTSPQASGRDTRTSAMVLTADSAGQRVDALERAGDAGDRGIAIAADDVDADLADAWALAAQSHPTMPALAAQRATVAPRPRRRTGQRHVGVERDGPGR